MSKSLKRVTQALTAANVPFEMQEMPGETRTAQQAAEAAGCHVDQIAKSIILANPDETELFLFITAGGRQVDMAAASALAGCALSRPGADPVRRITGFAVGGVAPLGHLNPIKAWFDPVLQGYDLIWAAGGTPRHIFSITPQTLLEVTQAAPAPFSHQAK